MQCKMCNNSYCSCKSSCSSCHLDNSIVYFINEVIKNWLTPAQAKENKKILVDNYKQIDAYTMMEYLTWVMSEESFQLAKQSYDEKKSSKKIKQKIDTIKVSWKPNPNPECEITGDKTRGRCVYCGRIARYVKWTICPMYWIAQEDIE